MDDDKVFVFTYGTLKRDFHNHFYIENDEFIGTASTKEAVYSMVQLGSHAIVGRCCPGVKLNGSSFISGEVYAVNKTRIPSLDQLEEEGTRYKKQLIPLTMDCSSVSEAWIYIHIDDTETILDSTNQISFSNESNTFTWILP